jgi:hypothetical protein
MPRFRKIWFGEKSGESFKLLIDINCHTKSEFFFLYVRNLLEPGLRLQNTQLNLCVCVSNSQRLFYNRKTRYKF